MDTLPRITIRNLLNTVVSFPEEVRNDPWSRSCNLDLSVVKYFLGEDWLEKHIRPAPGANGFVQVDLAAATPEYEGMT
jgi:hypothetical protein